MTDINWEPKNELQKLNVAKFAMELPLIVKHKRRMALIQRSFCKEERST